MTTITKLFARDTYMYYTYIKWKMLQDLIATLAETIQNNT